ncbi:MAG: exodeoxyribonuclease VII large subunit [Oscillospiraceae bacterium]|nr:exodeoxyribonuclease VII large subunit [Oscillospiraceae bacterium]
MDAPVTVSELTERIKGILDLDPVLRRVIVRGELSNYKIYPSGHHYFTLKDAGASLRCVMFKSDALRLRFRPENGLGVLCTGRVSVYPRDGAYQLYVSELQPDGVGDLFLAFEQLKARLQAEGLFDPAHKKPIPAMPGRIAVITSGAGAAVRDVIRVLGKRWPLSKVIVVPVRVQGTAAPAEIAGAIRYVNRWQLADLIITGRGGGSMEDLWAFNEELVARAIYDSVIPVISAVGHEPDVTIADFVADLRAATPSNGAELAVPVWQDVRDRLLDDELRLGRSVQKKLAESAQRLSALASRPIMSGPMAFVEQRRQDLDRAAERLDTAQRHHLSEYRQRYIRLASALEAMSPLKVLSRGYSVATDEDGSVIRSADAVEIGGAVHIRLEHGGLDCRVEKRTEEIE